MSGDAFNCFCAGTRIATAAGKVAGEALQAKDRVLRADGGQSMVKQLGRQEVDVRKSDPRKFNPICITKGALLGNVPARDLWVSGDPAVGMGGYLVDAFALVDGWTVYHVREMPLDGFIYHHDETQGHELILAGGCPAESFVDYTSLDAFKNADEREAHVIQEVPLPLISAARMRPEAIKAQLLQVVVRVGLEDDPACGVIATAA